MSSSDPNAQTYEGWTNYATWGVALVLDNDQGTYERVREEARAFVASADLHENVESGIWTAENAARYGLSDFLRDYVEILCGLEGRDTESGVYGPELSLMAQQLIHAGLSEVNWDEIAATILEDLS